jgi:hypothetical protein
MKKKEKEIKLSDLGNCTAFASYCPKHIWNLIFKLAVSHSMSKELQNACKDLDTNERGAINGYVNFSTNSAACVGFSMGYVMGQLYNVKDGKYLPKVKAIFKKHLSPTVVNRAAGEKRNLPFLPERKERRVP